LSEAHWEALPGDQAGCITHRAFRYDASQDVYVCPMGEVLAFVRKSQDRRKSGAVRTEWLMVCTVLNLGVLIRHWQRGVDAFKKRGGPKGRPA